MANGFAGISPCCLATSCREVVKLDIFEAADFVEGVLRWPRLDPVRDTAIWVEDIHLGLLFVGLLALLFGFLLALGTLGSLLLLRQPVLFFLFSLVMLELSIPSSNFATVLSRPGLLHLLGGLFFSEGVDPLVAIYHRLPQEIPFFTFKAWADCLSRVFNDARHVLDSSDKALVVGKGV